jgi:hypothetical protein
LANFFPWKTMLWLVMCINGCNMCLNKLPTFFAKNNDKIAMASLKMNCSKLASMYAFNTSWTIMDLFYFQKWRFSWKPMSWSFFAQSSNILHKTPAILSQLFWRKYYKNHNIGPRMTISRCMSKCSRQA